MKKKRKQTDGEDVKIMYLINIQIANNFLPNESDKQAHIEEMLNKKFRKLSSIENQMYKIKIVLFFND